VAGAVHYAQTLQRRRAREVINVTIGINRLQAVAKREIAYNVLRVNEMERPANLHYSPLVDYRTKTTTAYTSSRREVLLETKV